MKTKHLLYFLALVLCFFPLQVKAETTPPSIQAESAILMDAKSKTILYEKNAYDQHYPASITKLMTALLTIETLEPTDTITLSREAVTSIGWDTSRIGIDEGEQISVDSALHGLLLESANEVANGLAEAISGSNENFGIRMTRRAEELGAHDTNFVNPHGLHDENHYTTAYDMALIASYLSDNVYFLDIMKDTSFRIPPTNKVNEERPINQQHEMISPVRNPKNYREDVIGGKTGYTNQAKHTLVTIAKQGDTTLVAVILKADRNSRYTDTATLLDYGFDSYYSLELHTPIETLKTLPIYSVQSGQVYQAGNCSISVSNPFSVLVNKDITRDHLTANLNLPEYLLIGSKEGDTIGEITYLKNAQILGKNDLVIKNISYLPDPVVTSNPTVVKQTYLSWHYILLALILFIALLFLIRLRRLRKRRANELKFHKLFK